MSLVTSATPITSNSSLDRIYQSFILEYSDSVYIFANQTSFIDPSNESTAIYRIEEVNGILQFTIVSILNMGLETGGQNNFIGILEGSQAYIFLFNYNFSSWPPTIQLVVVSFDLANLPAEVTSSNIIHSYTSNSSFNPEYLFILKVINTHSYFYIFGRESENITVRRINRLSPTIDYEPFTQLPPSQIGDSLVVDSTRIAYYGPGGVISLPLSTIQAGGDLRGEMPVCSLECLDTAPYVAGYLEGNYYYLALQDTQVNPPQDNSIIPVIHIYRVDLSSPVDQTFADRVCFFEYTSLDIDGTHMFFQRLDGHLNVCLVQVIGTQSGEYTSITGYRVPASPQNSALTDPVIDLLTPVNEYED